MEKNTISYLLTVDSVITDQYTLKRTCVGIFEIIRIPAGQESLLYQFNVFGKILNVDSGKIDLVVKIIKSDGSVFKESFLAGDIEAGDLDITASFPFNEFKDKGRYYIKVFHGEKALKDDNKFYFDVM